MDDRSRGMVTGAVMGGVFISALDTTIVAAAMPSIAHELGGWDLYSWPFAVYIVASTATVPLYGRLADATGRKRLYHFAVGVFLLGSVLCGIAPSMPLLVAARLVQGLGAGGILPLALTMAGDLYGPEARGRIMGRFSSVWALASILGPLVGGGIVDGLGWRWVFLLNLPFGALSAGLLQRYLIEPPRDGSVGRPDFLGAVTFTLALGALLTGLMGAGKSSALTSAGGFAVAAVLGAAFVVLERRAEHPLVDTALLRLRVVAASNAVGFFSGGALFALAAYVPLWVRGVLGEKATMAGFSLTPMSIGWLIGAVVVGRILVRSGARVPVVGGLLALAGAGIALVGLDTESSLMRILIAMAVIGLGFGFAFTATLVAVQNAVDRTRLGQATSSVHFFRSVGGVFGVSIAGSLQLARMRPVGPGDGLPDPAALAAAVSPVFLATLLFAVAALAAGLMIPGRRA